MNADSDTRKTLASYRSAITNHPGLDHCTVEGGTTDLLLNPLEATVGEHDNYNAPLNLSPITSTLAVLWLNCLSGWTPI